MPSLVVIGAQWGDEGKGKLVDYLTSKAEIVARFHGGSNAGHTLVVDGVKTKLSLVPSGILRKDTICLIGAGVVLNPLTFIQETTDLQKVGVDVSARRLIIDRDAQLVLQTHIAIDQAREEALGKAKIGTTGRGIGPCYEDRASRIGVRLADLNDLKALHERLQRDVEIKNQYLKSVLKSDRVVSFDEVWQTIETTVAKVLPHIGNVSLILDKALKSGQRVVFEGAQGTLLDQMHGTVPFVTSSNTLAGAVTTGCGIGAKSLDHVLAVCKAYSTRVGSGPFPTELHDDTAEQIRKVGQEFGTNTGRARRCGWFDAVAMKRAVRLNGADSLAITKLDVLSGIDKLKICIKYKLDGVELDDMPSLSSELDRVVPEYIEFDGWSESLDNCTKWHHLPANARLYLTTISDILGCPISMVSVGPERDSTIFSGSASFVKNFVDKNDELTSIDDE
jgi:adenylosuccinate synthase